jgi:hypothetical protein
MPFVLPDKKRYYYAVFEDAVPDFPVVFGGAFFKATLENLKALKG